MIAYDGKLWELADDGICEIDDSLPTYEDCRDCPLFTECYLQIGDIPKKIIAKRKENRKEQTNI